VAETSGSPLLFNTEDSYDALRGDAPVCWDDWGGVLCCVVGVHILFTVLLVGEEGLLLRYIFVSWFRLSCYSSVRHGA
jgi:hypothetical protein